MKGKMKWYSCGVLPKDWVHKISNQFGYSKFLEKNIFLYKKKKEEIIKEI